MSYCPETPKKVLDSKFIYSYKKKNIYTVYKKLDTVCTEGVNIKFGMKPVGLIQGEPGSS